jgi:triosephosphate isomerase
MGQIQMIEDRVSVAVCPPFPYLALVGVILKDSPVALGAQNVYPEEEGAFTGEVSPTWRRATKLKGRWREPR